MSKKHKLLNKSFEKGEMYFLKHTIGLYATIITITLMLILTFLKDINKIKIDYKHILILIVATFIVIVFAIAFKYEITEYNKRKLKYNFYQLQMNLLDREILKYQNLLDSNKDIDDLETKLNTEYHIQLKNNQNSKEILKFIMKLNGINKKKAKFLYRQNKVSEDKYNYFQAEVIQQKLNKIDISSEILH